MQSLFIITYINQRFSTLEIFGNVTSFRARSSGFSLTLFLMSTPLGKWRDSGHWSSEMLCVAAVTTVPSFHFGFVSFRNETKVWRRRGPPGCRESAGWGQPLPQELEHVARIQPLWFWRRTIYIQISLQLEPGLFQVAAAVLYLICSKK